MMNNNNNNSYNLLIKVIIQKYFNNNQGNKHQSKYKIQVTLNKKIKIMMKNNNYYRNNNYIQKMMSEYLIFNSKFGSKYCQNIQNILSLFLDSRIHVSKLSINNSYYFYNYYFRHLD